MLNAVTAAAMQDELKKIASTGLELGGLGILAAPHVYHELTGKKVSDKTERRAELAGLGALAAGTIAGALKHASIIKKAGIRPGTPMYQQMMADASRQAASMPQMGQQPSRPLPNAAAQSARQSSYAGSMQGGSFQPPKVQKAMGARAAALQKAPAMQRGGLPMAGLSKVTGGGALPGAATKGIGGTMGKITNWGKGLVAGVPKLMGR